MTHELNIDAVAPQDIETCGLADNETFGRLVSQQLISQQDFDQLQATSVASQDDISSAAAAGSGTRSGRSVR